MPPSTSKSIDFNARLAKSDRFDHTNFYDFADEELRKSDFQPDIIGTTRLFSLSICHFKKYLEYSLMPFKRKCIN